MMNQHRFRYWLGAEQVTTLRARFMGPTWGPPGACRPQVGPMLAPWILLSGKPQPDKILMITSPTAHMCISSTQQVYHSHNVLAWKSMRTLSTLLVLLCRDATWMLCTGGLIMHGLPFFELTQTLNLGCLALYTICITKYHDDVIKWKHFLCYWPFVLGIHQSPVNSPHKGQWCGALMFSLVYAWTNGWVNNQYAGDLRGHHAHYDIRNQESGIIYSRKFTIHAIYKRIHTVQCNMKLYSLMWPGDFH